MTRQSKIAGAYIFTLCFLRLAFCATGASTFQWQFTNSNRSSLTQCSNYSITVVNDESTSSVPPYYMIAWKSNGVPTVTEIGSNSSNLSWQTNEAAGSTVLLLVADSDGNSGGNYASILSISDGDDSSCLPNMPSENITLTSNATETLDACEPLGLTVTGGTKPYTISIAVVDSEVVTNYTLGQNDDTMTYINRANPNSQMFVSVSDANGVWGQSPSFITTSSEYGALVSNCNDLVSSSSNSADSDSTSSTSSPEPTSAQDGDGENPSGAHTTVIIATVVPITVVALLILIGYLWRRRTLQKAKIISETTPVAWRETPRIVTSPLSSATSGGQRKYPMAFSPNPLSPTSRDMNFKSGMTPIYDIAGGSGLGYYAGQPSSPSSNSGLDGPSDVDIIIQHRDAGSAPAVREVPPPYTTAFAINRSS